MYYCRKFLILVLMLCTNISYAYMPEYQVDEESQNDFVAGQVWSYETRKNEDKSILTILKVDHFENAVVVHIRLDNINLIDPNAPQGVRTNLPHMAFLQTALQKSVIKLLNKNKRLPEFSKEYKYWREGDGAETAWAWHFSVSEALNGLERNAINEQQSSSIENRKNSTNSNN